MNRRKPPLPYRVRPLQPEELPEALALIWRVFCRFEAPEYSARGIQEFQRFIQLRHIAAMQRDGSMLLWGAFAGRAIAGVLAAAPAGHINLLFVDSPYQRRGIARTLHETALACLLARGADCVTVNSSPYAVPVYEKLGYSQTDTEQTVNGIRFTPMRLDIADSD